MNARDERLEAAVKALREQGYDGPTAYRYAAAGIIVGDAVRAFDEQQTVRHLADRQRQSNAVQETQPPAVSQVGADPPWLDEADLWEIFARELDRNREPFLASSVRGGHDNSNGGTAAIAAMKEAIRFAAAQPPSEAEIEEAASELVDSIIYDPELDAMTAARRVARAALLAAARVRAGG